jgi:hypothetical protein
MDGADDENPCGTATGVQFAQDEAGLDGFAQADVVGDEEPRAGEFQRSQRRDLLVGLECDAGSGRGYQAVVTRRQAKPDRIHQKLKPRQPPGSCQVQFRNRVGLDVFEGMQYTDLLVPERLIEGAEAKPAYGLTIALRDRVSAQDLKSASAHTYCCPRLKLRMHDQTL